MLATRRLLLIILVAWTLIFIFSKSPSLREKRENNYITIAAIDLGTETTAHKDFINKLTQNTELSQRATIRVFLGPYALLFGNKGILIQTPPNYYVFIDTNFYRSLNQNEKEALIAHELGHAVYKINFMDKLRLRILNKLKVLNSQYNEFFTKDQIRADQFSAEKTSPGAMISLLNKLYLTDKYNRDYRMRIRSLGGELKQGH
jgi:hypothetical protein